jgi:hypothetical protein
MKDLLNGRRAQVITKIPALIRFRWNTNRFLFRTTHAWTPSNNNTLALGQKNQQKTSRRRVERKFTPRPAEATRSIADKTKAAGDGVER